MIGMPAATVATEGTRLGEITIAPRFNGPEASANGGYACGRLAAFVGEPAEVTLRLPPPLERPLAVLADGAGGARMLDGDALVGEARVAAEEEIEVPLYPSYEESIQASQAHPGRGMRHPLSDCFVCSPYRAAPGDGLGISPGPLDRDPAVGAAPFEPDESLASEGLVRPEVIWAALDCPSYAPSVMETGRIALLGRLQAWRNREVRVGERIVAIGWTRGQEGRKHHTAAALLGADGSVAAASLATWIELRQS